MDVAEFTQIILTSGRAAIELALFILLPVMLIMLTFMRILEQHGILDFVARLISPILKPFGIPGLGVFAAVQVLFVSFAAPIATLAMMNRGTTNNRHIAATLAMVFAMAQANVTFPMAPMGLHVGYTLLIAVVGGLVASASTYYVFARNIIEDPEHNDRDADVLPETRPKGLRMLIRGAGREAIEISIEAIPMLVLALFFVNVLKALGVVGLIEQLIAPLMELWGMPPSLILAIITKFIAGGTAMMGVMNEFLRVGVVDALMLNRAAGLLICPLDLAGVAVMATAGTRVAKLMVPAVCGALVGLVVRAIIHTVLF